MWMSETTDLLNELNMLQGDICGSDFEEKDEFFNMFYKLKKRLTLYAGLSIGDQLDKITNFEPASNVTI